MTSAHTSDFLQAAWEIPEPHEIFRTEEFLITPDRFAVVPHHVLVVARKPAWAEMSSREQARFLFIGSVVREYTQLIFEPARGVGFALWGNKATTPHIHILPRNTKSDGELFFAETTLPEAPGLQLAHTQQLYRAYFAEPGFAAELERRLGEAGL